MRKLAISALMASAIVFACDWARFGIRCLEAPTVHAQQEILQDKGLPPPLSPTQTLPKKAPPFAALGDIQSRWDYSDLVCVGRADVPVATGVIERLGEQDRDQLESWVIPEKCLKGQMPGGRIRVLGDRVYSSGENSMGSIYAGPTPGFLTTGRNLLFLRKTDDPGVWRATIPVYAACIALADVAPAYQVDESAASIRHALIKEFEAVIDEGKRTFANETQLETADADDVAREYLPYLLQVLGRVQGIQKFKILMSRSTEPVRREIAMALLQLGDLAGEAETLALLEDKSAVSWKRENAAFALANATSTQARQALERVVSEPGPDELHNAARESLARMSH